MIAVIISVLSTISQLIITPLTDVSGVRIINTAVWSSEAKYHLVKQSEQMRLHHFIRWPSSFVRTELDSTSNSPKVMKGHTRYTRHSCSSFQDRNVPRRSCIQTCHPSTCRLSVNCNITVALKSSAPVPHFAVLLVNYLGQGTFDFVETSLLILGASSVVPLLEQR